MWNMNQTCMGNMQFLSKDFHESIGNFIYTNTLYF